MTKKFVNFFCEIESLLYSLQQQQQYVVDPQADQKHLVNPEFYNDLAQQQQQVSRFHGKNNKKKCRQFFREIEIRFILYSNNNIMSLIHKLIKSLF